MNIIRGFTYTFNQTDSLNSNHPLALSTTSDGTHGGGVQYTEGWGNNGGVAGSSLISTFTVPLTAPNLLYYYCQNHSGMGGDINVSNLEPNNNSVEGTNVLSTGESSSTKALHTNGDGTCVWKDKEGTEIKSSGQSSTTSSLHTKGDGTCVWKETEGVDIKSSNIAQNNYLKSNGDGTSTWGSVPTNNSVEGTDVLSTNVSADNFLKSNGDGTSSWAEVGFMTYTDTIRHLWNADPSNPTPGEPRPPPPTMPHTVVLPAGAKSMHVKAVGGGGGGAMKSDSGESTLVGGGGGGAGCGWEGTLAIDNETTLVVNQLGVGGTAGLGGSAAGAGTLTQITFNGRSAYDKAKSTSVGIKEYVIKLNGGKAGGFMDDGTSLPSAGGGGGNIETTALHEADVPRVPNTLYLRGGSGANGMEFDKNSANIKFLGGIGGVSIFGGGNSENLQDARYPVLGSGGGGGTDNGTYGPANGGDGGVIITFY